MTTALSFLGFLRTAWPIVTLLISLWSGMHAATNRAYGLAHVDGAESLEFKGVHVAGAGALSIGALLATIAGGVSNHRSAVNAPSKAPAGVNPVAHQLDVLHSAMTADSQTTDTELDILNTLVKGRLKKTATAPS